MATPLERPGRVVCGGLAAVDAVLGTAAAFFPAAYLALVHPHLPAAEHPADWVVRTGVLWLAFCLLETLGALSRSPGKWFFCVAMLRLVEVPADVAYWALARGASEWSRSAILSAPLVNTAAGLFLLQASRIRHGES